jgi:hypothetical protein
MTDKTEKPNDAEVVAETAKEITIAEMMAASKQIDKNEAEASAKRQAEALASVLKKG